MTPVPGGTQNVCRLSFFQVVGVATEEEADGEEETTVDGEDLG